MTDRVDNLPHVKFPELYRDLVETTKAIIWEVDLTSQKFNYIGPQAQKVLGYPRKSWINFNTWVSRIHPEDRDEAVSFCLSQTEQGLDHTFEYRMVHANGSTVWIRDVVNLIRHQGQVVNLRGFFLDITDEKRTAQKLVEHMAMLGSVIETITHPVTVIDARDHTVLLANSAASADQGDPKIKCYELSHRRTSPCEGTAPPCPLEIVRRTRKPTQVEHIHYTPDGQEQLVEVHAYPAFDNDGQLVSITEYCHDVSQRRTRDAQLRQAQKLEAIGTLAGGIAHDFNNVLFSIRGNAELGMLALSKDDPQVEVLTDIISGSQRAMELVRQILTFARQDAPSRQPVELQYIVNEVLQLLRAVVPSSTCIRRDILHSPSVVLGNATELHQVMLNLATNAHQAIGSDGGELFIGLSHVTVDRKAAASHVGLKVGSYARLRVADTGPGMAPEIVERIFEPYYTTKPAGEGTGMGLAVAHGIVTSLGGQITVDTEPGAGARFDVLLPLLDKPATAQHTLTAPIPGSARILVVEDERSVLFMLSRMLSRLGYSVQGSADPAEALEFFEANPTDYDLVLTDLTMPNMNGDELARSLLALRPNLPIIIMTGFNAQFREQDARAIKVHAYLQKPVPIADLSQAIREALAPSQIHTDE